MKKNTLFLITICIGMIGVFSSCNEQDRGVKAPLSKQLELDSTSRYYDQNYKIYTLEGCEYVVSGYGNQRWGSHKGNCKNPIHNEKK